MADIAVLGIGLDTRQAERNAKNLTQGLNSVANSAGKMSKEFLLSMVAFASVKNAANLVKDQLSAIVTTGMQFQASMSQVKAVSGATQAQFEQLTAAAKHLGETTKFSASEAANGLVLLSQAGLKAEQSIAALPDVLNLAAAGGLDMGTAADIATNAMSGMRLGVQDLTRITDVFAKTATSSNTNVAAMGESFKYVASIGASAGVSVERLSAMIGILGNAGIQGSMAGTQLAFGISKMASEGKDFFEVLKQLEATGADTAEVMDLFGERAGRAVLAILGQGVGTLEQFEAQLMSSGGAAKEMARIMSDNLAGDAKNLSSAIEAVRLNFFDVFNEDLRAGVQAVTGAIRENKDNVIALAQPVTALTDFFGGLVGQMGGLNNIIQTVGDGLKTLSSGFIIVSHGAMQMINLATSGIDTILNVITLAGSAYDLAKAKLFGTANEVKSATTAALGSFEVFAAGLTDGFDYLVDGPENLKKSLASLWKEQEKAVDTTKKSTDSAAELSMASWKAAESAAKQATETKELTKEVLDLDNAFNILTRATQELNIAEDDQKIKADFAAEALYRQKSAADSVAGSFQVATAEVKKYADQTSRAFATGSILGDMGGLVGSTFSVESPMASAASPASQMSAFSASPVSSGATSNISGLMSSYDRLANQITDYLQKDAGLDIKLKDAEQELRTLAGELANVGQNELEKQLELSEQYFATVRKIDDLQSQISKEQERTLRSQQSTAQGLGSILDSVLSDYNDLTTGDFAQLLPVERVQALSEQFNATAAAVDKIDWTNITKADEQLIQQFQSVSKSFLDESQKVFKSSANYDAIRTSVKGEFDALASSLAAAMAAADPATFNENMDKLKTSFAGLSGSTTTANTDISKLTNSIYSPTSAVNSLAFGAFTANKHTGTLADTILNSLGVNTEGTNTKTATFAETLKTLGEKTETSGTEAKAAAGKTTDLSNTLSQTAAPLATTSGNLETVANNTAAVFAKIVADSAAMKTAIEQQKATLDTRQAQIDAISVFSGYQVSGSTLQGLNQAGGLFQAVTAPSASDITVRAGGQEAYVRKIAGTTTKYYSATGMFVGQRTVLNDGSVVSDTVSGKQFNTKSESPYYSYDHFAGGQTLQSGIFSRPFASGAWSINKQVQPANLHQGEMVIRSDDAPAVRGFMASTGRASSYGAPDSGGAMGYDSKRMIELLAEIADLLGRGINPQVFLNAKKVSEELDRFRSLSA